MIISDNLPSNSLLQNCFTKIDYQDSFGIEVYTNHELNVDDLIRLFLVSAPSWVVSLMSLRDKIARLLHLKTHSNSQAEHEKTGSKPSYDVGEKFGLFELTDKSANEALLGTDDTHLNFRVSLYLQPSQSGTYILYISTIVKINNKMGWIYFNTIDQFHTMVVKSFLKQMKKNIEKGDYLQICMR